ncbi:MAG: Gfo/Idh/MocA family oxidoreductase [Verrucomicrobiales bacterium]
MSSKERQYGWGLLGPGRFARAFAAELRRVDRARPVAVASRRSPEKAVAFAEEFGFEKHYGSYEDLLADEAVDIVYVVVPHIFHREVAEMALDAGKAVLCEKPLTPSAVDSLYLTNKARRNGRFLMEAMKTRFLPVVRRAKQWIDEGRIGEPRLARADFCFHGSTDPEDRLMNPYLAGGAVLDVGIYPLFLTRFLLGEVRSVCALGTHATTKVEDSASMVTSHESGATAAMTCSFRVEEAMGATISGTEGAILLPKFHAGSRVEFQRGGETIDVFEDDSADMLRGEIEAAMDALDEGLVECPEHTHADTVRLAEIMDDVRRQIGTFNPVASVT